MRQMIRDAFLAHLTPGASYQVTILPAERHTYLVEAEANHFYRVYLDQRGIDLGVTICCPNGTLIRRSDRRWHGVESASLIAASAGPYQFRISSTRRKGDPGRYTVELDHPSMAGPRERSIVRAEEMSSEAKTLIKEGRPQSSERAAELAGQALELWRDLRDIAGQAQALNTLGFLQNAKGGHKQALEYFDRALRLWRELQDVSGEAETRHNIAAAYSGLGRKQEAIELYTRTLKLRGAVGDIEGRAFSVSNRAFAYLSVGSVVEALEDFLQAVSTWNLVDNAQGENQARIGLGLLYTLSGESEKALQQYQLVQNVARSLRDWKGNAYCLANKGKLYEILGQKQRALDAMHKAANIMRKNGDAHGAAQTTASIGSLYFVHGTPNEALKYFERARDHLEQIGDQFSLAYVNLNISRCVLILRNPNKAAGLCQDALSTFDRVGDRRVRALAFRNLAEVQYCQNKPREAVASLRKALSSFRQVRDGRGEADSLLALGRAERALGRLSKAQTQTEKAIRLIESHRTNVISRELRSSYFASKLEYYEFYIHLLIQMHHQQPEAGYDAAALKTAERSRSRTLLDRLSEAGASLDADVDPDLASSKREMQARINLTAQNHERLVATKGPEKDILASNRRLDRLLEEYDELDSRIRRRSPKCASLSLPTLLSEEQIRSEILDSDTVLLEYALGHDRSHLWVISPEFFLTFELPPRLEIESVAGCYYSLLTMRNETADTARVRQADAMLPEVAGRLSSMLLGQVAPHLRGKHRLVIVADGALHHIPFESLPFPRGTARGSFEPLVRDWEVVMLPSASVLGVLRSEFGSRSPAPKTLAVFADPVYDPRDPRIRPSDSERRNRRRGENLESRPVMSLPRLYSTRSEGQCPLRLVDPSQAWSAFGFSANRDDFLDDLDLSQFRIIHFAGHSICDLVHPALAGIVLSLFDEQGRPQNGWVRLHEIYGLKLAADLIVLSACDTARGRQVRGEGPVSLARGFMHSGVPRIISSLWHVENDATTHLMELFYTEMLGGKQISPAAALHAAQKEMSEQKDWQSPYYWAAFVLQGEWKGFCPPIADTRPRVRDQSLNAVSDDSKQG